MESLRSRKPQYEYVDTASLRRPCICCLPDALPETVISVFHNLNLAAKYCDEIYVLKNGRIITGGSPENVITSSMIKEVFHLDSKIIEDGKERYVVYKNVLE